MHSSNPHFDLTSGNIMNGVGGNSNINYSWNGVMDFLQEHLKISSQKEEEWMKEKFFMQVLQIGFFSLEIQTKYQ